MPSYSHAAPGIIEYRGIRMKEFPVGFKSFAGKHVVFSGGGYFRLCPYPIVKAWSREAGDYLMSYIHPRDLDAGQPMLKNLPLSRKFKSYVGLGRAETKLRKWLSDFRFVDIEAADKAVDWNAAFHLVLN